MRFSIYMVAIALAGLVVVLGSDGTAYAARTCDLACADPIVDCGGEGGVGRHVSFYRGCGCSKAYMRGYGAASCGGIVAPGDFGTDFRDDLNPGGPILKERLEGVEHAIYALGAVIRERLVEQERTISTARLLMEVTEKLLTLGDKACSGNGGMDEVDPIHGELEDIATCREKVLPRPEERKLVAACVQNDRLKHFRDDSIVYEEMEPLVDMVHRGEELIGREFITEIVLPRFDRENDERLACIFEIVGGPLNRLERKLKRVYMHAHDGLQLVEYAVELETSQVLEVRR